MTYFEPVNRFFALAGDLFGPGQVLWVIVGTFLLYTFSTTTAIAPRSAYLDIIHAWHSRRKKTRHPMEHQEPCI